MCCACWEGDCVYMGVGALCEREGLCAVHVGPQSGAEFLEAAKKILLPSARHLEEGRGTTILELLRRENCISGLCPRPLGSPPPPPQQPNRVKNT